MQSILKVARKKCPPIPNSPIPPELSMAFLIAAGSIFIRNGDSDNTPDVELGNLDCVPTSQHISSHQTLNNFVPKTWLRIRQKFGECESKVPPRHLVSVVVNVSTGATTIYTYRRWT